jgi:hypothetical protein
MGWRVHRGSSRALGPKAVADPGERIWVDNGTFVGGHGFCVVHWDYYDPHLTAITATDRSTGRTILIALSDYPASPNNACTWYGTDEDRVPLPQP